ncbi:MAG: energy transducer TonB [Ignavibacteriae bacterium]|nr:MAG: energy transducer TonB [Ignavibacteriota bacterium]
MKTLIIPAAYGYQELRLVQQRYMTWSLMIALSVQVLVFGGYHAAGLLKTENAVEPGVLSGNGRIIDIIPLPPPLEPRLQNPGILNPETKFSAGIPVPVPDIELRDPKEFDGWKDIPKNINEGTGDVGEPGPGARFNIPPEVETDPLPDKFQPTEFDPVILIKHAPQYPVLAQRVNLEGSVYVKVLVDKKGNVKKALVVKTDSELFTKPALEAAMKWFFKPALMNGKPVAVWVSIPFHFRLSK